MFNDSKRKINLGGTSSVSSHATIMDSAKQRRNERIEAKRRQDAAIRIQSVWRGSRERQLVKRKLRKEVENSLNANDDGRALRYLSVLGCDAEALGMWAKWLDQHQNRVSLPDSGAGLSLLKPVLWHLLESVAANTRSPDAAVRLSTLLHFLTVAGCAAEFLPFLLEHGYYTLLGKALKTIPVSEKNSPSLPLLVKLIILPLPTSSVIQHIDFFTHILTVPLLPNRLPLGDLTALSAALGRPLNELQRSRCLPIPRTADGVDVESCMHLLANLTAFTPARYSQLAPQALAKYIELVIALINALPVGLLDPVSVATTAKGADSESESESDSDRPITVTVVNSFATPSITPESLNLDPKSRNRLLTLFAPTHLHALLSLCTRQTYATHALPPFTAFVIALSAFSPKRKAALWSTILSWMNSNSGANSGLLRNIYREYVRGSKLWQALDEGSEDEIVQLTSPSTAPLWPSLLFLTEVYTHSLVTMGDDEFFGTVPSSLPLSSSKGKAPVASRSRNPLMVDEVKELTRRLMSVVLVLYWSLAQLQSQSQSAATSVGVPMDVDGETSPFGGSTKGGAREQFEPWWIAASIRISWSGLRERLTKFLVGIRARDSRRPFIPPDYWSVLAPAGEDGEDEEASGDLSSGLISDLTSDLFNAPKANTGSTRRKQIDLRGFVDAALFEPEELNLDLNNLDASIMESGNPSILAAKSKRGTSSTLTKRHMTYLLPRLNVLHNIPFAIPFQVRVVIFRMWIAKDREATMSGASSGMRRGVDIWSGRAKHQATIRRGHVAQDGFDHLGDLNLKEAVEISFVDQWGQPEAGIDGGGVFKEFFTSLCKEVFDTDRGLWLPNNHNELYPNPSSYAVEPHSLNWYRFIGRILGKAMYDGILVDVAFAGFFLSKWLALGSKQTAVGMNLLDDLESLDKELYDGLIKLKHFEGDVRTLALTFEVDVEDMGETKTVQLIKNGSTTPVTNENRLEYVQRVAHFHLSQRIRKQSEAFFEGLSELIQPRWLKMFNQHELQVLIGGVNTPIDIEDLRANTVYGGLYDANEPTIVALWNVLETFTQDQRRAFLRFVTSCSRPPLLGFKELSPNFAIRDAGSDQQRLPTSSTCVNLLKLPRYRNERVLREKLLHAINAGAGFDLS